ncbi:MAG: hypothetical protein N4A72_12990 [Bacteroidales bacterium]|jgi:hypothetical protein|nr:hypothetical protein [Bacteroidales bacterium]
MSEIAIIGEYRGVTQLSLKNIFNQFIHKDKSITEIENGNVLTYEGDELEFCIEPYPYKDICPDIKYSFYFSARYYGKMISCEKMLNSLAFLLKEEAIEYSIDYQLEDENGNPIGEEFHLS